MAVVSSYLHAPAIDYTVWITFPNFRFCLYKTPNEPHPVTSCPRGCAPPYRHGSTHEYTPSLSSHLCDRTAPEQCALSPCLTPYKSPRLPSAPAVECTSPSPPMSTIRSVCKEATHRAGPWSRCRLTSFRAEGRIPDISQTQSIDYVASTV